MDIQHKKITRPHYWFWQVAFILSLFWLCESQPFLYASDHEDEEPQYRFQLLGNIITPAQGLSQARFKITSLGDGQEVEQVLDIQAVEPRGFQKYLPPMLLQNLNPLEALPQDLGKARKKILVQFDHNHHPCHWEGVDRRDQYPLHGQWQYQEDRDRQQTLAELRLRIQLEDQTWHEINRVQKTIPHTLVRTDPEIPGRLHFDGITVYKTRTAPQLWQEPRAREQYLRNALIRDNEVPTHEGYHIVFVEPFALPGDQLRIRNDYVGNYDFDRHLAEHEKNQIIDIKHLIYSDGTNIYLPYVTQELWCREPSRVCFLIASYAEQNKISFYPQANIEDSSMLAEGLYQRISILENQDGRIERWKKFNLTGDTDTGEEITEIEVPRGISSIRAIFSSRNQNPNLLSSFINSGLVSEVSPTYFDATFFDDPNHLRILQVGLLNWSELKKFRYKGPISREIMNSLSPLTQLLYLNLDYKSTLNTDMVNCLTSLSRLNYLSLIGSIGDATAGALSQALAHLPQLEHFHMGSGASAKSIGLITQALNRHTPHLKGFTVRDVHLFVGPPTLNSIFINHLNFPHLKMLNLNRFGLGDGGLQILAPRFQQMPQLRALILSYNSIGDAGVQALAQSFQNIRQLRLLDLAENDIGNTGAQALANQLGNLVNIKYFSICNNNITNPNINLIAHNMPFSFVWEGLYAPLFSREIFND